MPNQIPDPVKSERLDRLQALLRRQQDAFNRACIGRTLAVLLDRTGRHHGQLVGRSPYLQPVQVAGAEDLLGEVAEVEILSAQSNSLTGRLAADGPRPIASRALGSSALGMSEARA